MKQALLIVTLFLATSSMGWAVACSSATLNVDDASGFSCSIDGKTFSNFGYSATASGGATVVPDTAVNVIPCPSASPFCVVIPTGEEGFVLTAPWGVTSNQAQDSAITYTVSSTTPLFDALLLHGGFGQTGTGFASVAETLSNGGSLFLSDPPGFPSSVTLTFAPAFSMTVLKDIEVNGGTSGTAAISEVANGWSQMVVPEPASMTLLATGLAAISCSIRRQLVP